MPGESKTSPRRIAAKERQRQALELRKAGVTLDEIAKAVGFKSRQAAHDSIQRALMAIPRLAAEELRNLDLERLDKLALAVWPKALQGDIQAINAALAILTRRAKLLGLEAPVKFEGEVQQYVHNDPQQTLYDRVASVAARSSPNGSAPNLN